MALGGGNWNGQDKILPGTYINFANPSRAASALAERGIVAVPLTLNWGPENVIFQADTQTIAEKCKAIFGYALSQPEMLPLRELFKGAQKLLCYRMQKSAAKAKNTFCQAKYGGTRGNDLKTVVTPSLDRTGFFQVRTLLDNLEVDAQDVETTTELKENDYVEFLPEATLLATAGLALTGGTQGDAVTGAEYQAFLRAAEPYSFHVLCCPSAETDTIALFTAYTKRLSEESGAGFQLVCYRPISPDWEGVIGVENKVLSGLPDWGLVYWVSGVEASCALNQCLTGRTYDGELQVDLQYSQSELKNALTEGKFMLHSAGGVPKVLRDINTLISFTEGKGADFSTNQTIRVCTGIGDRVAALFNSKYLGITANDQSGRICLWNDICKVLQEYQNAHAIVEFNTEDVEVLPGDNKKSVLCRINKLTVAGAMEALYMNIMIA